MGLRRRGARAAAGAAACLAVLAAARGARAPGGSPGRLGAEALLAAGGQGPRGYHKGVGQLRRAERAEKCRAATGSEKCVTRTLPGGEEEHVAFDAWLADRAAHVGYDPALGAEARWGLPERVDWREKGVVTPAKDQGQCGSCWTFASTEALESSVALATGHLMTLSEQQILDCTPNPKHCGGTGGCQGGIVQIAYDKINEYGGLSGEWQYPYLSYTGTDQKCAFLPAMVESRSSYRGKIAYNELPINDAQSLMAAVASLGPVAVSVDASEWHLYQGGVFDACNQDKPDIDHAVVLVGYGTDDAEGDYWLVRNSWGAGWGEDGYIRVRRTSDESSRCGVDSTPKDGVACDGDPPKQTVCGTCGILTDSVFPELAH